MLCLNLETAQAIADDRHLVHLRGVRKGTINASAFADAIGVSKATISRALDGGGVGTELLERMHAAFGCSLDSLVIIDGNDAALGVVS